MTVEQQANDFPLPADIEGFWQWDKMHCPRLLSPITEELFWSEICRGFSDAMDQWASPVAMVGRAINYYGYFAVTPVDLGSETQEERIARYQAKMEEVLPCIGDLWVDEWLPSILPGLDRARTTDYGALSDDELFKEFSRMREDCYDRYVVHGWINFVLAPASLFADLYNETFQPDDPTEPYLCLQGFPTKSLDAGRGLWHLRDLIKADPGLTGIFENNEPDEILRLMESTESGRLFLGELRAYLDEYGWRSDAFEFEVPSWRENPEIPLNALQGYLQLGEDSSPEAKYRESVELREKLLAAARERLAGDPEKLGMFEGLYDQARHYLTLTEDHNFYIDQIGNRVMRLPLLEIGRRLVDAGRIAEVDDVFLLYTAEIGEAMDGTDQNALATRRKEEMAHWSTVLPIPIIGEPAAPSGDPFEAGIMKMFGMPVEPSSDPDVIMGTGASPGVVRGTARVVKQLSEASKLRRGDILVCEMTMPAWTPLFSTAAAVVADTGGVLSHCAIVSREYRMPCVVGTLVGTDVIKDGMELTVDGSTGVVRIESRPS